VAAITLTQAGWKVTRCSGSPTALLRDLPRRSRRGVLPRVYEPAEQLITPLLGREPVTPQRQRSILCIHDQGDSDPVEVHHVVVPAPSVRRLDVHQC